MRIRRTGGQCQSKSARAGKEAPAVSADAQSFALFQQLTRVIRLTVVMYIRYPLSLRQVEDVLFERGIDICHEIVRLWWNRFGPLFVAEIRQRRVHDDGKTI